MSGLELNRHKLMNGNLLAHKIINGVKKEIEKCNFNPRIAAIIVKENPIVVLYQKNHEIRCKKARIRYSLFQHKSSDIPSIKTLIEKLNKNNDITGIFVQFPLPKSMDDYELLGSIALEKDIAGLNPDNVQKFCYDSKLFAPCIAEGLMRLLQEYKVEVEGKKAVIIGTSRFIGTPIAQLLEKRNALVTKLQYISDQESVQQELKAADIVISMTGDKQIIKAKMLKEGVITIDCAYRMSEREFNDDIFFKASLFSSIPHGIGPMMFAIMIENTLKAYKQQRGL